MFSGERISIIRNAPTVQEGDESKLSPILIQLRLFAFYNSKDKAIGLANVDLGQFIGKQGKGQMCKVVFMKCFDKNANITFDVKVRELAANAVGAYVAKV